ncbi:MAG: GIY-YIG nuclease family protein [Bacteroidales bacterium]|nr:GIY-YIG nuclease family protein [Bacteroidales bacterium]
MKYLYVYILECSDKSYYTGVTNDIERRMFEHNSGYSPKAYTYRRRPVKLLWLSEALKPSDAISLEKQIKGWSRPKKEAFIYQDWNKLKELSKSSSSSK